MKKTLPVVIFLLIFTLTLQGQKDSVKKYVAQKEYSKEVSNINVRIYPVPVTRNSFTIRTEKGMSYIKITNIIGQDVFRVQYNEPQQLIKISLDSPKRGMYFVTIIFSDGVRVVKKIMVEQSE